MNAASPPRPERPAFGVWGLFDAAGAVLALGTFLGFLGRFWWGFELASHFRVQLAAGLALVAAANLARRRRKGAGAFAVLAVVNAAVVTPTLLPDRTPAAPGAVHLRLLIANVHTANPRFDLVRELIRSNAADLVLLMEVDERWMRELAGVTNDCPFTVVETRDDNFGIALFSRHPLTDAEVVEFDDESMPSISATVMLDGTAIRFWGTHPLPPGDGASARQRNRQLSALAGRLRGAGGPVIVAGDLNTAPWGPWFRRFMAEAGLKNTSQGRGLFATWPAGFRPLRIPLDHCLVSPEIQTTAKRLGPDIGSDHLPVIVELAVPRRR